MKPIIIIAAHGSEATQQSNAPIHALAETLESSGKFELVTAAFLNGDPSLDNVLDHIRSDIQDDRPVSRRRSARVIVIPAMTSEGYYSNVVFPRKLAENTSYDSFDITVTPAIGVAPKIANLVANRVKTIAARYSLESSNTTVVIVGHGTRRNPHSGDSTYDLVSKTSEQIDFPVVAAFIDQDPEIEVIRSEINTANTIAIPFLMGLGPHATDDVPEAFGMIGGSDRFPKVADTLDGYCVCDQPIGVDQGIAQIAFRLIKESLNNPNVSNPIFQQDRSDRIEPHTKLNQKKPKQKMAEVTR